MGESAGAGSIMHHLVGNRGTSDPLFKRAVLQSPAFEPQSAKKVLDQYTKFEKDSGCAGLGLACLRTKTTAALQNANLAIVADSQYGTFGFGPTIDNTYIYDYPGIEMASGNYWKDVSIIYAHNSEEGVIFADPLKIFNSDVDNLLKANFPNMTTANFNAMTKLYPYPGLLSEFLTNFGRLEQTIGDWVVNCNTRFLAKAYAGKAYGYVVTVPPGVHGLDLFFTFWRTDLNIYDIIQVDIDIPLISDNNLATGLQSYLTSFVRTGNPNTYRQSGALPPTINMVPSVVSTTDKVLNVGLLAYSIGQDDDSRKDRCDFWESGVWTGR